MHASLQLSSVQGVNSKAHVALRSDHPLQVLTAYCRRSQHHTYTAALPSGAQLQAIAQPAAVADVQAEGIQSATLQPLHVSKDEQHGLPAAQPQAMQQPSLPAVSPADESARKARLWKAAIKLPMYSVGYIPVLVGGALVYHQLGIAPAVQLLGYMLAAVCIIAWLNLSNDLFDSQTGVDETKPESVVNLTGSKTLVAVAATAFFAVGAGMLAWLLSAGNSPVPAAMLAFSIACGYVYQGPPFRLSYKGLGEPLCFMAFGPSATTAFYLAMITPLITASQQATQTPATTALLAGMSSGAAGLLAAVPTSVWAVSILVGLTTTIILLTSHFHQIEGDKAAGKMSPLVRVGLENGLKLLQSGVGLTYALLAGSVVAGLLPWTVGVASLASLPAAKELLDYAVTNYKVPALVAPLKKFTCMWHIAFGGSLAAGLAAARLV